MGKKDQYRERFTSLKSSIQPGVYYPEASILWTTWREDAAKGALDDDEQAEKAREQLDAFEDAKAEAMPLVIAPVSDIFIRQLEAKVEAGDLEEVERDALLVIECVHVPRTDENDEIVWTNGQPAKGEPLYDAADRDYLMGKEHTIGGELFRLKMAVATYIRESTNQGMARAGKLLTGF